jgi:hypothetical protein
MIRRRWFENQTILQHFHGMRVEGCHVSSNSLNRAGRACVVAGAVFALILCAPGAEAPAAAAGGTAQPAVLDVLVYRDGDRTQGHLVERVGDVVVFKSERFGVLRVPADQAEVILAKAPAAATGVGPMPDPVARAEAEADERPATGWSALSPRELTVALRRFFGPWHGRFAFSVEAVSDASERNTETTEAKLQRKWDRDVVQLNAHYDFSRTNGFTTTDVAKADGSWRHDFPRQFFSQYRPTVEWNRAYVRNAVPSDYVLLQQEIDAGFRIFEVPDRQLRVGLSESLFDVWNSAPQAGHSSRNVEGVFVEAEWKLPWRMTLSDRGAWYYSIASGKDGWENRLELNKKLTETISIGVRHELRYNDPDLRSQDYKLLKLLFGLDF